MLPAQLHEYTGADINVYFNIAADYLLCGGHSDAGRPVDSGNMSHETYHGGVQEQYQQQIWVMLHACVPQSSHCL